MYSNEFRLYTASGCLCEGQSNTVNEMYEPYLIPQDYGLHTDIRWLKITNEKGVGLLFSMDQLFNFNVYPFANQKGFECRQLI